MEERQKDSADQHLPVCDSQGKELPAKKDAKRILRVQRPYHLGMRWELWKLQANDCAELLLPPRGNEQSLKRNCLTFLAG